MEEYIKEYKIIEKTEIQKEIELIKTIIDTREKLKRDNKNFEYAQGDLVDYYTYQIKANQAKLDYLIKLAKTNNADVLIVDTAGRLHNKKYLMDELNKIQKVINKEMPESDKEVLLVIDGTTGQNAIQQVKAFKQEADITGLVLTKLDGTAKGGVVIGIVEENKIPVNFIGIGEQIDDMEIFNSEDFVKAII